MTETPVPISDKKTMNEFNQAILKSKLLYEHIEVNEEFQCGIMYNGEEEDKRDATLIYTSSVDKKIHTARVDYPTVNFQRDKIENPEFKPLHFRIATSRNGGTLNNTGVVSYTGKVIVPPIYSWIDGLGHSAIIGKQFIVGESYRDHKVLPATIYNYQGRELASGIGTWTEFVNRRASGNAYIIIYTNIGHYTNQNGGVSRNEGKELWQIFVAYKGDVYKSVLLEDLPENQGLYWFKNKLSLRVRNHSEAELIKEWKLGDLLENAEKL